MDHLGRDVSGGSLGNYELEPAPQGMGAPQASRECSGNVTDAPHTLHDDAGLDLGPDRGATNVSVTTRCTRSDHPGVRVRGLRPQNPAGDADGMTGFDS